MINKTLTFSHGIHPEEYKNLSSECKIERMPFVDEYTIPLSQHIGVPSESIVKKGQKVHRGEMIARPGGFVSVAQHAPVDGTVTSVDLHEHPNGKMQPAIKIKSELFSNQHLNGVGIPLDQLDSKGFIDAVQSAGIVGLGGAAFPAHVKFSIQKDKNCRYIIINGCECEPFLTSDHRIMIEYCDELLDGIAILNQFIKAHKILIGIEANKPDAIDIVNNAVNNSELPIEVIPLKVKYPQGAEKMLITAILNKEVPSGKLPLDVETLVSNVGTIAALSNYFRRSIPLIERVVTVTGTAIKRPANVMVPIGTPLKDVIDLCGGITHQAARILLGGPLMGIVQKDLDVPVIKGTSGIVVLTKNEVYDIITYNCIRCGRCVEACPLFLNPSLLGLLARKRLWEEMEENHLMDCFECGSCSYVCPSGIPLVQSFRVAKAMIRELKAKG